MATKKATKRPKKGAGDKTDEQPGQSANCINCGVPLTASACGNCGLDNTPEIIAEYNEARKLAATVPGS